MELINNIWMALSTPNEALVRMLNIPLFFVENFLLMSLFLLLANKIFTNCNVANNRRAIR